MDEGNNTEEELLKLMDKTYGPGTGQRWKEYNEKVEQRIIALGQEVGFARGWTKKASHALFYNNECLGLDKEKKVDIHHILGEKFDYDELMNA